MEQLKNFFQEASKNEEIKQELNGHRDPDSFCQQVVESGEKLGYTFSKEEVKKAMFRSDNRELTDKELATSSGGEDAGSAIWDGIHAGLTGTEIFSPGFSPCT